MTVEQIIAVAGGLIYVLTPREPFTFTRPGTDPPFTGAGRSGVEPLGGGSPGTHSFGSAVNADAFTAAFRSEGQA